MLTRAGLRNDERKGRRAPTLRLVTVLSVHEASRHDRLGLYGEPFQHDKEKLFDATFRSGLLASREGLVRRPSGKYRLIPLEP